MSLQPEVKSCPQTYSSTMNSSGGFGLVDTRRDMWSSGPSENPHPQTAPPLPWTDSCLTFNDTACGASALTLNCSELLAAQNPCSLTAPLQQPTGSLSRDLHCEDLLGHKTRPCFHLCFQSHIFELLHSSKVIDHDRWIFYCPACWDGGTGRQSSGQRTNCDG